MKSIIVKHPNGKLHYVRYECPIEKYEPNAFAFENMDRILKNDNGAEKYLGMTIRRTETKVMIQYDFE